MIDKGNNRVTNHDIVVDGEYDYVEFGSDDKLPVTVKKIKFDGWHFVIEFQYDGDSSRGATIYPEKLKLRGVKPLM